MKKMRIKKLAVLIQALFAATLVHAENTTYDTASGTATIPEVVVDGKVAFVNVKLKSNPDGTFSILSTEAPPVSPGAVTYDPATGLVTLPAVQVDSEVEFTNVKLGFNQNGTLSVLSYEIPGVDYVSDGENTIYQPIDGTAIISEVVIDGKVAYVNVELKANPDGTFSILSTHAPQIPLSATTYDPATDTIAIPAVEIDGLVEFTKVKLELNLDQMLLRVLSNETPAVVQHSENCSSFVEASYTQDNHETVIGKFCNQGDVEAGEQYPVTTACTPSDDQLAKVEVGMTYDQVVELAGCHPLLSNPGKRASYFWGTKWEPDVSEPTHQVGFFEGKIANLQEVACGPLLQPCNQP
jgi:hypothetical protein